MCKNKNTLNRVYPTLDVRCQVFRRFIALLPNLSQYTDVTGTGIVTKFLRTVGRFGYKFLLQYCSDVAKVTDTI